MLNWKYGRPHDRFIRWAQVGPYGLFIYHTVSGYGLELTDLRRFTRFTEHKKETLKERQEEALLILIEQVSLVEVITVLDEQNNPVLFYGEHGDWGEFSNWWPAPIRIDGIVWPTTEHYYMSQKTKDPKLQLEIRRAPSAREAKRLGRKLTLRKGWDSMKFDVMLKACRAKFNQHEDLKQLLLSTGYRPIHENCSDPWWGGGPHFPEGKNLLGKVLVQVRKELRQE